MRIRCKRCDRKISIDHAFAGGVCRCPYCKEINFVPGSAGGQAGDRPAAPRGARPDVPTDTASAAHDERRGDEEHVPTADPVKVQGIVSIILLGAMLAMIAGGIALVVHTLKSHPAGTPATKPAQPVTQDVIPPPLRHRPFTATGVPNVVGIAVSAPVIYCLDAGSSMDETFDFARLMTMVSAASLREGEKFNILTVNNAGGDRFLRAEYLQAGKQARPLVETFLQDCVTGGDAELGRGLGKALAKDPATIVLFSRKDAGDLMHVAKRAKAKGVRLVTITLDGGSEIAESMRKLAEATGAVSRAFSMSQLDDWASRTRMPD